MGLISNLYLKHEFSFHDQTFYKEKNTQMLPVLSSLVTDLVDVDLK